MRKVAIVKVFALSLYICLYCGTGYAQCDHSLPVRPAIGWGPGGRPPTACELQFYRKYYPMLLGAFAGLENDFSEQWQEAKPPAEAGMADLMDRDHKYNIAIGVAPGSERSFFINWGEMTWIFKKGGNNTDVAATVARILPFLNEQARITNGKDTAKCRAAMMEMEFNFKYSFTATMLVNQTQDVLEDDQARFEDLKIKGCIYALRVQRNKKITDTYGPDADPNLHMDELRLYIGKWLKPQINNGKGFKVVNNFNATQPKLSVQNIMILIKCCPALQDEVAALIDIKSLDELIEK